MKHIKLITLIVLIGVNITYSQESVNSGSGNTIGTNGSISYSIGQIFYENIYNDNGSSFEGVQQPYEINTVLEIIEPILNFNITVFPNPTIKYLTIDIDSSKKEKLKAEMVNLEGKVIFSKQINSITRIYMENKPITTYFLNIYNKNKIIKTFKIIKK